MHAVTEPDNHVKRGFLWSLSKKLSAEDKHNPLHKETLSPQGPLIKHEDVLNKIEEAEKGA
jgi:hypothetical protein